METPQPFESEVTPLTYSLNMLEVPNLDLLVFSHLRWDFVFQRPQQLMTRMARHRRVFFVEEPVFGKETGIELQIREPGVTLVVPHISSDLSGKDAESELNSQISQLLTLRQISKYTAWYYTPMAIPYTRALQPQATIYDWMNDLSLFKNPPEGLISYENELLRRADLVYTGGYALFEAKQNRHENIYPFPSSIDAGHFRQARTWEEEPEDQRRIPKKRIGFFGVLDERFDCDLIASVAELRPDWQIVLIGPIAKIDPATLPRKRNIHYLGKKNYKELPAYLSGWDLAILPFSLNDSTRYISPTKTPEYLAAGCPVVSTPITDVVRPYGEQGLVRIARTAEQFVYSAEDAMAEKSRDKGWQVRVDEFLSQNSWEITYLCMAQLERETLMAREAARILLENAATESRMGA